MKTINQDPSTKPHAPMMDSNFIILNSSDVNRPWCVERERYVKVDGALDIRTVLRGRLRERRYWGYDMMLWWYDVIRLTVPFWRSDDEDAMIFGWMMFTDVIVIPSVRFSLDLGCTALDDIWHRWTLLFLTSVAVISSVSILLTFLLVVTVQVSAFSLFFLDEVIKKNLLYLTETL